MRITLAAGLLVAAVGCNVPARDNPYDPGSEVSPTVEAVLPAGFTCLQWQNPAAFPLPDFDLDAIEPDERAEIEGFCDGSCPDGSDIDECERHRVITSVLRTPPMDEPVRCTQSDPVMDLRLHEVFLRQDKLQYADIVIPSSGLVTATSLDDGGFEILPIESVPGPADPSRRLVVTDRARERFAERVLLTRPLEDVRVNRTSVSFTHGNGANVIECVLRVEYEQAHDAASHPSGLAGGYGHHVAIADLALDDGMLPARSTRLEFATSYTDGLFCYADILFHTPSDGLVRVPPFSEDDLVESGLVAECGPAGPTPVASGAFLLDGEEAFAFLYRDFDGTRRIHYVERHPDDPYRVRVDAFDFSAALQGPTPRIFTGVGDLWSSARHDLALVSSDGSLAMICSPDDMSCLPLAAPDCLGAGSRFVAVADRPGEVDTEELFAAVQSSAGTCLLWYSGSAADVVLDRTESFPGQPERLALHWTTVQGAPASIAVGLLDPTEPHITVREFGPAPRTYPLIRNPVESCEAMTEEGLDFGASGVSLPFRSCQADGSGCALYSNRVAGVPGIEVYYKEDDAFVAEGGALAFQRTDPTCGDFFQPLMYDLSDIVPTRMGSALAARLDPPRARFASNSVCVTPGTMVIGAPGDGMLGGQGRVIVLYDSAGTTVDAEPCVPIVP